MSKLQLSRTNNKIIIRDSSRNSKSSNGLINSSSLEKKKTKSTFIDRNYTSQLSKCNYSKFKLITDNELKSVLYAVKDYYNAIMKETEESQADLNEVKEKNQELIRQVEELKHSKEFSVNQKERIIVSNSRENTDNIKAKIKHLNSDLNDIKSRHKFEGEYTTTVNYMIEEDKIQLENITETIKKIEDKLKDISRAHSVLKENTIQKDIIVQDYDMCLTTIDNQIEDVENVIETQNMKQSKIDRSNQRKEAKVSRLKQILNNKTVKKKEEIEKYKIDMLHKLDEYRFKKAQMVKKETKYIDLILGMHLIQKYLIGDKNKDNDNNDEDLDNDLRTLKQSEDYKVFSSNQYTIIDKNDEVMMTTQSTRSSKDPPSKKKKAPIKLEDLRLMFNMLDMTYDDLYTYLLKIKTKEQFTREHMILLNQKAITLENKKMQFTNKVNEIIAKDYKNFEDLIKLNSHFADFVQSNNKRTQIEKKAKIEQETNTYFLIHSFLTDSHIHPDIKIVKQNSIKFLTQSRRILNDIKASFEEITNAFVKCKFFTDYDEINMISNITPVGRKYSQSSNTFLKPDILNKKEYLVKILNYAIDKLNSEDAIYIKNLINEEYDLKQILDSDWIMESEVFEFYHSIEHMKTIVKILENITLFYEKKIKDYDNQRNKIRNSISNPVEANKMIFFNKKVSWEKKGVYNGHNNFGNSQKKKKSFEGRYTREQSSLSNNERYNDSNNLTNNKQTDLDDSFTENNKKRKLNRPSTSSDYNSNSIVNKLYQPTVYKTKYARTLNEGLDSIRRNTLNYRRGEFKMSKKWNEVGVLQKDFFPYSNPSKLSLLLLLIL